MALEHMLTFTSNALRYDCYIGLCYEPLNHVCLERFSPHM